MSDPALGWVKKKELKFYRAFDSFSNGSTALCWALAAFSVS
jgi:hypothetical protein